MIQDKVTQIQYAKSGIGASEKFQLNLRFSCMNAKLNQLKYNHRIPNGLDLETVWGEAMTRTYI